VTAGIKDVAAEAGVSVGTVSNVLNRPDVVAPATRDRVLLAIHKLGFVRNESARQLRAGRSRTIGLVVLDVSNPFFTDVAHGAELMADRNGVMVVLCNSGADVARERRHLDMLQQQRVLGVLITPVDSAGGRLDELARSGISVVLVDRASDGTRCSVAVDDVLGGSLAMTHLMDQGHRRVAFVGGPFTTDQVADRLRGATDAVYRAQGGVEDLRRVETTGLTIADGHEAAAELAGLPITKRPTAVFCSNDLVALGLLHELTRRGLRVPQDVALVGYDDIDFAVSAAVPLSSVRQPRDELGETATRLLLDEVRDGSTHRHEQIVFEPELVVRDSSSWRRRRRVSAPRGHGAIPSQTAR
jgi:DNA-binding LacI/PurR family transcriptional regulator